MLMTTAILGMELRLRARIVASAAVGLIILTALVGALYPSLHESIGDLNLPAGAEGLIGGGELSTIAGWLRTEILSVYGPLIFAGVAITAAAGAIAGDEEDRILALVLAHPVPRPRLVVAKAAAIGILLVGLAVAAFAGMAVAVALAGGGISLGHLAATAAHLLLLGLTFGALALALGAGTGRRTLAAATAGAVAVAMYLVNGLAPTIDSIAWLKYLTAFHYYEARDPLTTGLDLGQLAVLAAATVVLTVLACVGFARRDLRG